MKKMIMIVFVAIFSLAAMEKTSNDGNELVTAGALLICSQLREQQEKRQVVRVCTIECCNGINCADVRCCMVPINILSNVGGFLGTLADTTLRGVRHLVDLASGNGEKNLQQKEKQ